MNRRALVVLAIASALGSGAWGCGSDAPPTMPTARDSLAPIVQVVFPPSDGSAYDRDGNGLLDVEVSWSDSAGRVDPGSAKVVCLESCPPGVPADTNLALGWRVVRRDSGGLELEETIPLLLRGGGSPTRLRITVADTARNVSPPVTLSVALPPGALHRLIGLEGPPSCQPSENRAVHLVLTPDGQKGFAPFLFCVAVFDPEGVQPTRFITSINNAPWWAFISLDTATGLAYISGGSAPTGGITVFDTRTEQVVRDVGLPYEVAGAAVDGERLYVGEACTNGRIHVLDKRTYSELGRVEVNVAPNMGICTNSVEFAFSRDHRTGWAGIVYGGLVRFDAEQFTVLGRAALDNSGTLRDIVLAQDRWLYAARMQFGLHQWDTQTGGLSITGREPPLYKELAVSPDGQTLVMAGGSGSRRPGDTQIYGARLYDVPGMSLRYAFPEQFGRFSEGVVWHPDGKRFYMAVEFGVEVYLVRPK